MAEGGNVLDEARTLIKKRLAEIDAERKQLERALAELGGKARRRGPGRPRGSGGGGPGGGGGAAAAPAPTRR